METMTELKINCSVHVGERGRFGFGSIRVHQGELVKVDEFGVYLKKNCKEHGTEEVLYPHPFVVKVVRYGEDRRPSS